MNRTDDVTMDAAARRAAMLEEETLIGGLMDTLGEAGRGKRTRREAAAAAQGMLADWAAKDGAPDPVGRGKSAAMAALRVGVVQAVRDARRRGLTDAELAAYAQAAVAEGMRQPGKTDAEPPGDTQEPEPEEDAPPDAGAEKVATARRMVEELTRTGGAKGMTPSWLAIWSGAETEEARERTRIEAFRSRVNTAADAALERAASHGVVGEFAGEATSLLADLLVFRLNPDGAVVARTPERLDAYWRAAERVRGAIQEAAAAAGGNATP